MRDGKLECERASERVREQVLRMRDGKLECQRASENVELESK
jgi:hypothetical protein